MNKHMKNISYILLLMLSLLNSACNAVTNQPKQPLAYITNQGDNTVSVIDTASNQVIKTIKVGKAPVGVAVSAQLKRVYISNVESHDISVIDTQNNTIIETLNIKAVSYTHLVYQLPPNIINAITSRIKLLGRMDMVEKRRPQDGRIKTVSTSGQEIELRLSTMPTAFGEKMVMRIFTPEVSASDFLTLGFSKAQAATWNTWTKSPNGIILVTGPTGSGKTTTLYATLRQLATPEVNVCTVEEPIEMVEPAFNQMQVQTNIGLNFADCIRTLMRQDPDIIMVGEIRDLETADMAIQAALTGHLVLSTLHTNDSPSAVTRLLDLGVPSYLIHSTVLGVMAQRLVRTLCTSCKAPEPIEQSKWDALVGDFKLPKPAHIYKPVGCLECRNTGFRGRSGIYEMLTMTPGLRKLITPDTNLAELTKLCLLYTSRCV